MKAEVVSLGFSVVFPLYSILHRVFLKFLNHIDITLFAADEIIIILILYLVKNKPTPVSLRIGNPSSVLVIFNCR